MPDLDAPWALLLLPLPYLIWRFLPAHTTTVDALQVPFFARLTELSGATPGRGAVVQRRSRLGLSFLLAIWFATVLALTGPTLRSDPIVITKSARDLMLAVDLSGSMETQDLENAAGKKTDRLSVVKEVVGDFVQHREGDRLALMVFGDAPYLQVPFTLDTSLVTRLLDECRTRMAGNSTTIGDAIGLAIRTFERSQASNRVLILLTDGNDTGSGVPPLSAASIVRTKGIAVHVIGVGDPTLAGEARLNEDVLQKIAETTGGKYFHAANREELEQIYKSLDELEKVQFESRSFTPTRSVFHYPLGAAAVLMSLFLVLLSFSRHQRPAADRQSAPSAQEQV